MTGEAVGMDDLNDGEDVLLVFTSHYNSDATQVVYGVVADTSGSPVDLLIDGNDGDQYKFTWEGDVEVRRGGIYRAYGADATLNRLVEVDPSLDNDNEEP